MWLRAALSVGLRGPGKALLVASACGWIATGWLLTADRSQHSGMSHSAHHFTALWLAMILAMAPPLLVREIGRLWRSSLRRMRYLVIVSFLCGYVCVWLLTGVVFSAMFESVAVNSHRVVVAFVLVAAWYCSPARQRCLNGCHRVTTLRVFGWPGQRDSLRYGASTGCYCIGACGLLMFLVLMVKDHHLSAMAVTAAVTTLERYLPARRPEWHIPYLLAGTRTSPGWSGSTSLRWSASFSQRHLRV